MKSNSICISCGEAVRTALDTNGRLVIIDIEPVPDGIIWIEGYTKNGMARVRVVSDPAEVPRSEPTRYLRHRHKGSE